MSDFTKRLTENLAAVRERIAAAANRSGRSSRDITLVAVTKYVDATIASMLAENGCIDLGESRPQELWQKASACSPRNIRWHLVGHLQRNKVRRTLPIITLIHSIDSTRLLEEVDRESAAMNRRTPVLFEVNISGDAAKHGLQPAEMSDALKSAARCRNIEIRGLMAMAGLEGDLQSARDDFRRLRQLRDRLRDECQEFTALADLSMGMSGDFEVAIEEGATIVRIGSVLFEGIAP
jgi:pyridoxal phosphate enzyme (YggS family)